MSQAGTNDEATEKAEGAGEPSADPAAGTTSVPSASSASRPGADGSAEGSVDGAADGAEVTADLDALLADAQRERDEYLELAQRARADFENFRRRAAVQAEDAERRGRADLAKRLVPAIDNLERALKAVGGDLDALNAADAAEPVSRELTAHQALTAGIALVHKELLEGLSRGGVEAFDPHGEAFDPNTHEALSSRPAGEGEGAGVVAETLERGYRIGETLIRPARVVVTQ
jgi:molecular chaperone GrpE